MKKVTNEDLNDVYYRSLLLSDRLEELEGIIDGTGTSLLPMITDENGKSVPEKVDALAAEILESFRHRLELDNIEFPDWEKEMYSCFLYCAMQMYREKHNRYNWYSTYTDIPGTFGDIIDAAGDVVSGRTGFESYRDFFTNFYTLCRLGSLRSSSLVERIDNRKKKDAMMSVFCKNSIKALDTLGFNQWEDEIMIFDPPHDLHIELCERFAREHKDDESNGQYRQLAEDAEGFIRELDEKRGQYYSNPAEMDEMDFDLWLESQYDQPSNEIEEIEYREKEKQKAKLRELDRGRSYTEYSKYDELKECSLEDINDLWQSIDYDDQDEKLGKWREFAADKDILQKRFARFIQLYCDHDCSSYFLDNVKDMVTSYLIENKLCSMAFGDDYGLINHKLRTAIRMISHEIERVRNRI